MAPLTTQAQAADTHHDAVLAAIDELRDRGGKLLEVLRDARPQSEREVEDALAEHGLGAVVNLAEILGHGLLAVAGARFAADD
jgi:hypothetical protein